MFKKKQYRAKDWRNAFLEDFNLIKKSIYKLCLFYSNSNEQDADDLFQDITLVLYDNYKRYNRSREFFSWAYRVSLNYIISTYRKQKVRYFQPTKLLEDMEYNDYDLAENKEALIVLMYSLIEELSENEKKLVKLYLEGRKRKDIALIMGMSEENVSQLFYRIKVKLQKMACGYEE